MLCVLNDVGLLSAPLSSIWVCHPVLETACYSLMWVSLVAWLPARDFPSPVWRISWFKTRPSTVRATACRASSLVAGGHLQQGNSSGKRSSSLSLPLRPFLGIFIERQFLVSPLAPDSQVNTESIGNAMNSPIKSGVLMHPFLCPSLWLF